LQKINKIYTRNDKNNSYFISNKHLFTIYEAIMEILDEFDIKIIKEWRKMVEWLIPIATNLKNIEYHGASTHQ
jgi:hypothetical protein